AEGQKHAHFVQQHPVARLAVDGLLVEGGGQLEAADAGALPRLVQRLVEGIVGALAEVLAEGQARLVAGLLAEQAGVDTAAVIAAGLEVLAALSVGEVRLEQREVDADEGGQAEALVLEVVVAGGL